MNNPYRHVIDPGARYGTLVVVTVIPDPERTRLLLKCDCGETIERRADRVARGLTLHCGCQGYRRDAQRHAKARAKVPARKRRAIAQRGGIARRDLRLSIAG